MKVKGKYMVRFRYFFLTSILVLFSLSSIGQTAKTEGAYAGGNGIYVYLGEAIARESGTEGIREYVLSRKSERENSWKEIYRGSFPEEYDAFYAKLEDAVAAMSFDQAFLLEKAPEIWGKFSATGSADSVARWMIYLPVLQAMGLVYLDTEVDEGMKYSYRSAFLATGGREMGSREFIPVSYPGHASLGPYELIDYDVYDGAVAIRCYASSGAFPAALEISRKDRVGGPWNKLDIPYGRYRQGDSLVVSFTDRNVIRNNAYAYRVVPLDYFGNRGRALVTAALGMYNFKEEGPVIVSIKVENSEETRGNKLTWSLTRPQLLNTLRIYRSEDREGKYELLAEIPGISAHYIDQAAAPMVKYFYYVEPTGPMGEAGNKSSRTFGMWEDKMAPPGPMMLDWKGIPDGVRLQVGVPDTSLRIRICRMEGEGEVLVPVSPLLRTETATVEWVDNDSLLSGRRFYGYAAYTENSSYVKSRFSDTVFVRPDKAMDIMAPVNPRVSRVNDKAALFWEDMDRMDPLTAGYLVYRKTSKEKNFVEIGKILNDRQNTYTDNIKGISGTIIYRVKSFDNFGNISKPSQDMVLSTEKIVLPVVQDLTGFTENGKVILNWSDVRYPSAFSYSIYRYTRGTKPIRLGKVPGQDPRTFTDTKVKKGGLYFYYVIVTGEDKSEGKPSSEVSITVN